MAYSIAEIARELDLPFQGDGGRVLTHVSSWDHADDSSLVFLESEKDLPGARMRAAGCVIAAPGKLPEEVHGILSDTPKLSFARAAALLLPVCAGTGRRHSTAVISPEAVVADSADVGPHAVVGKGARIGARCILHAGVVVGEECEIGNDCILHPHVVLYPGAKLGSRVVLHAGAIIGSDGFGYVFDGRRQVKFPQAGGVLIEDDVEIGSNTTIDRGSLGITRIAAGAKIDNLVQVAHNVEIGRSVVIAAQTGISGSSVIEDFAVIGGQVGFGDHTRVQTGAVIGSKAGVLPGKIVRSGDIYWGVPVRPLREYKRLNALFGRLPEIKADLDAVKKAVAGIISRLDESGRNSG